jgi:hypothetical protein
MEVSLWCLHLLKARLASALHLDALTIVTKLHLLALCRFAARLAHRRCPPHLLKCPAGSPRAYSEESLLLIAWPALAPAYGLPYDRHGWLCIPSSSQQYKRNHAAGAPMYESLFVLIVLVAIHRRLIGACGLIFESAPILTWCRADPDAAIGHAPAQHPRLQFTWVSPSHPVVSGLRLTCVLPALPRSCPRSSLRSAALAVGCLPIAHPPSCHLSRCWLLLLAPHILDQLPTGNRRQHRPSIPNDKRTVPACHRPGRQTSWANAAALNAASGASSSSLGTGVLRSAAGLSSSRR